MVEFLTEAEIKKSEDLVVIADVFVKGEAKKYGDKINVDGMDKLELLHRNLAVLPDDFAVIDAKKKASKKPVEKTSKENDATK